MACCELQRSRRCPTAFLAGRGLPGLQRSTMYLCTTAARESSGSDVASAEATSEPPLSEDAHGRPTLESAAAAGICRPHGTPPVGAGTLGCRAASKLTICDQGGHGVHTAGHTGRHRHPRSCRPPDSEEDLSGVPSRRLVPLHHGGSRAAAGPMRHQKEGFARPSAPGETLGTLGTIGTFTASDDVPSMVDREPPPVRCATRKKDLLVHQLRARRWGRLEQ